MEEPDVSLDSMMLAWAASGILDESRFTRLIDAGASMHCVDERGRTPLLLAVLAGHVDTVRYLVDLGADVSWKDSDSRDSASYARSNRMLEALGLDSNSVSTNTLLIEAKWRSMRLT